MDGDAVKGRLFDVLIGGLAGFVLAAGLSTLCYDKSVERLKAFSREQVAERQREVVRVGAFATAQRHRADSLEATRRPVILRAVLDTTAATAAHSDADRARAIGDLRGENVALRVENMALRRAVVNLWTALQTADTIIALERARGDSLNKALADVVFSLREVNARVQSLKPPPQLLRIAWRLVEDVALVKAGYEWGKHQRCTGSGC